QCIVDHLEYHSLQVRLPFHGHCEISRGHPTCLPVNSTVLTNLAISIYRAFSHLAKLPTKPASIGSLSLRSTVCLQTLRTPPHGRRPVC
ncbi:hypothetical protein, partial [Desulfosporosinus sp. BICA1-9]|uniref:hypothetical protein n=1 Tax=Desulfosporosinus sp. BICA1-9 TaxID=1531958 RepID=UPI0025BB57CF